MRRDKSLYHITLTIALCFVAATTFAAGPRDIEFAGISWGLKQTSGPVDPGPNTFSNAADQVWIDDSGKLHLTLKKRNGVWTASELMAKKDAGYGIYRFDIDGMVRNLDPNIVFGFFTWDKTPEQYNRELDIELSRWGIPTGLPGWFTVQPYDKVGNQHSFDLPPASLYSFEMRWEPQAVGFSCSVEGKNIASWKFMGAVPEPGRARLRINLWLFRGKEPAGSGPYEVVLSDLRISPLQ